MADMADKVRVEGSFGIYLDPPIPCPVTPGPYLIPKGLVTIDWGLSRTAKLYGGWIITEARHAVLAVTPAQIDFDPSNPSELTTKFQVKWGVVLEAYHSWGWWVGRSYGSKSPLGDLRPVEPWWHATIRYDATDPKVARLAACRSTHDLVPHHPEQVTRDKSYYAEARWAWHSYLKDHPPSKKIGRPDSAP